MHTNLDISEGGVNDELAARIGLRDVDTIADLSLSPAGDRGVCRMGILPEPMPLEDFARHVMLRLGANGVKYMSAGREVRKVAVGGGSCGEDLPLVYAAGCDTFVTSELKHSQVLEAKWLGINLLDAGHFPTEDVICPVVAERLKARFPELEIRISSKMTDLMRYMGD
jgi:putative NIF3 family GTP cyclohydrolase 1 type 2